MKISLGTSYIITYIGSIISMGSAVFLAIIFFILSLDQSASTRLDFLLQFEINPYSALAIVAFSFIILMFCYYGKGKGFYNIGILTIILSVIILVLKGGFYIGPLTSLVGGVFIYYTEKEVFFKNQPERNFD
jgi:hypothetical protein